MWPVSDIDGDLDGLGAVRVGVLLELERSEPAIPLSASSAQAHRAAVRAVRRGIAQNDLRSAQLSRSAAAVRTAFFSSSAASVMADPAMTVARECEAP